jgi:heme/copper-type cytochrome/quinol oxidase subunit 1
MKVPLIQLNRPAFLFGALTVIAIIGTVMATRATPDSVLDIGIHDTYYVVPTWLAPLPLIVITALITLCYLLFHGLTRGKHGEWMGIVHFGCTVAGTITIMLPTLQMYDRYNAAPRRYYSNADISFSDSVIDMVTLIDWALVVLMVGQVVFIANIIRALVINHQRTA